MIKANLDGDDISLNDIFAGAAPFAVIMVVLIARVVAMPWLATGLL
ncbi:MAG: hypothetical protein ABJL99_14210 [Aliishimia sp.]